MAVIQCKNLHKDYQTGKTTVKALRGLSLAIESGEFLSIVGPSGSGKSTLLNLIGCLDTPTAGEVYIRDKLVKEQGKNELADLRRDNIGFVFQSFNLIPVLTAYENINFGLSLKGNLSAAEEHQKTMTILAEVGLKGMENRKPAELSGGQQQRIAVARAIVKEPALVLADEPTANLDSALGEEIMHLMQKLNRNKQITFIFSTHDPMVMKHGRRIIELQDGKIRNDNFKAGG
ncbi:MAG TPA: ABC transporter ATP-binding protein [Spirochaetota bacterium]|nr:ABC transporter ATP-binding protein [Spirochaetota bacterium]